MRNMAKPEPPRREQVFLATVAVDAERYVSDCARVLRVLRQAGYTAKPTNHGTLDALLEDRTIVPQFREIGGQFDPPPEDAA
jgi:hypothetical protein